MWSGSAIPGASTVWSGNRGICIGSWFTSPGGAGRRAGRRRPRVPASLRRTGNQKSRRSSGGSCRVADERAIRPRGSVRAALRRAAVVGGPEARAAAAAADGVGVVDGEARTHERVDVVDLAALDERDAVLVDVDADTVRLENAVVRRRLVLEHHSVAVPGAAAGVDVDPETDLGARLFLGQLGKLQRRGVGE